MTNISDYLYRKASIKKIPLNGTFELSPVCNFTCKMCYLRKTMGQLKEEGKSLIPWEQWLDLAEKCRDEGMLYLLLTGGEPFLYPGFKELYRELHKMGFLISINTNGTLIDDEMIAWLKEAAPHRVNITLYGTSGDTYQRICGSYDGHQKAVAAILKLKEAGISVVINASMIPENEQDLEEIIAFGRKHDIPTRVATYMFPPVRRDAEETDSRFSPEEAAAIYLRKQICSMDEDQCRDLFTHQLKGLDRPASVEDEDVWGTNMEYMRCRAGRSTFWVSWEGKMSACGMLPFPQEEYPFEKDFRQCWLDLTNTVRTTKVLSECNQCEKKEICNPCVAMLYAEHGDVNQKAPYLCQMTEEMIKGMRKVLQEAEKNEE